MRRVHLLDEYGLVVIEDCHLGRQPCRAHQAGQDGKSDVAQGHPAEVVMNLVINAAEAIGPGGGWVAVSTAERTVDEGAVADFAAGETLAPGHYAMLTVVDNGSGMDAETQSKIFDPFFTTKIGRASCRERV